MSAIRFCLENLYVPGDVEVTLFFQRKGRKNNWQDFKVWEKRMGDESWRIFKVHNNEEDEEKDEKEAKDEKEEEEGEEAGGEMVIEALQRWQSK